MSDGQQDPETPTGAPPVFVATLIATRLDALIQTARTGGLEEARIALEAARDEARRRAGA